MGEIVLFASRGCFYLKLDKINFFFFILHISVRYFQYLHDEPHTSKNMQGMKDTQHNIGHYRPEVLFIQELRAKKEWAKMALRTLIKFCKKQPSNCKMKSCSQCCSIGGKNLFLRPLRRDYQYLPK
ncbi:hypothetical protein [Methanosarcina sp. UBA5]|uniref:hypothetical protein n=1 Tax=Methanosarcina sp. UBA5 TaxID=1915593 RepID=UPI0025EE4453|nr:hypothetical protein [Methanosarcina sp. UBA5]